jgi:AraC-like DNA-binding protein
MNQELPAASVWPDEATRFPNPLLLQQQPGSNPRLSTALLQEALPLLELVPLEPSPSWWFSGGNLQIGTLIATAWIARPTRVRFSKRRVHIAMIGYGGEQRLRQNTVTWRCSSGHCLLMADAPCTMETTPSSAVAFSLSRDRLRQTALTMGGYQEEPSGWREILNRPHSWSLQHGSPAQSLHTALRQTLEMAGKLSAYGCGLVDSLRLDDQIHRLIAFMLLPDLLEPRALDRLLLRERAGRDSFDELIDYIKQNLAEPLTLTDLETRSNYSRRALQYAFAERLGCTATQWIKSQRLDRARSRLEHPKNGDTVGSIATECGYRSLGLFSVDFQKRFHIKPSVLLRESRQP